MRAPFPLLLLFTLCCGCGSDEERAPQYSAPGIENPKSCADIQAATVSGGMLLLEGKNAHCHADGLDCPLSVSAHPNACATGQTPAAHCQNTLWVLHCPANDGGTDSGGGKSDAGGSDAGRSP